MKYNLIEHRLGLIKMYEGTSKGEKADGRVFMPSVLDNAVFVLKNTTIDPYIVEEYVVQCEKAFRNTKLTDKL